MASDENNGSSSSSTSRQSPTCPTMTYGTVTGMISPLTLLKNNHHLDGVEQCQPQQHHYHNSVTRHYNRLKIRQAREKIKRYFETSKLLLDQHPCTNVIPRFDIQELTLGKVLGTGGFGTVVEIKSIDSSHLPQDTGTDVEGNRVETSAIIGIDVEQPKKRASLGFLYTLRRDHNRLTNDEGNIGGFWKSTMICKSENNFNGAVLSRVRTEDQRRMLSCEKDGGSTCRREFQPAALNFSFLAWRDSAPGEEGNDAVLQEPSSSITSNNLVAETGTQVNSHYRVRSRSYYQDTATREGESSYAIKLISPSIVENDFKLFLQAAIDLARETYFLSVLNHPNISKLLAVGQEDMFSPRYFLVLDRLRETLSDRIDGTWRKQQDHLENSIFHLHKSKKLESLWEERIRVMKDLAGALCYMHELKIIYRDIKPDNIGFDSEGNVKLFDFGLAREVREEDACTSGTYKLTPNTGSVRYMAPENANTWPYNFLADCYSFGILLWEVTALEQPYKNLAPKDIRDMVLNWGERPKIKEGWSARVVVLMTTAWDAHYSKRPTMKEIESELELELRH